MDQYSLQLDADVELKTCDEDVDPIWGIQWTETTAGSRDFQPCPGARGMTNGRSITTCNQM